MKTFALLLVFVVAAVSACPGTVTVDQGDRLIQTSETEPPKWLTQEQLAVLIENHVNFMDVTGRTYPVLTEKDPAAPSAFPTAMRFQSVVRPMLGLIDQAWMRSFVQEFSSFTNRYYNNNNGVQSSNWLHDQVAAVIAASNYRGNASVRKWVHSGYPQNSVVARIEGSEDGVVIMGAHQDSINSGSPNAGVAPGADDNGSGSVALLETLWVLLESGFVPKQSIEFQWYAAEEVGLRGSQDIAQTYLNQGVNVISMMNFDVVGYSTGTNMVSFMTDNVDRTLNTFLGLVADEYLTFRHNTYVCGYGCSDHASWTRFGFSAASPCEDTLFPSMHTSRDVLSVVDFVQVAEFVKLGIGYCVELAEPQ